MKTTTIKENGYKLPIGVLSTDGDRKGKLIRDFSLRPYKSSIDRNISDWMEANESKYPTRSVFIAARVAKFISLICSQFGDKAWALDKDKNSTPEQELAVYGMYYADVFYVYYMARIAALGPQYEFPYVCPDKKCKANEGSTIIFDLSTTDVDILEDNDPLEKWVTLSHPFKNRDGRLVKKLKIAPARWGLTSRPDFYGATTVGVSVSILRECVRQIDSQEGNYELIDDEIDEIHHMDIINIDRHTKTLAPGLDLQTKVTCICGQIILNPVNWTPDFFLASSLPISETESVYETTSTA